MTAAAVLQELLDHPPATPEALERRLDEHPAEELRAAFVALLSAPELDAARRSLFWAAMMKLGPGGQQGAFEAIALDRKKPRIVRSLAVVALGPPTSSAVEAFYRTLPPEDVMLGAEATLDQLVDVLQDDPEAGAEIARQLVHAKGPALVPFATTFVEQTLEAGVPLELFFGEALLRADLHALRPLLLRAFVEHGGTGAVDLLEQARTRLPGDAAKREVGAALLKLRTRLQVAPATSTEIADAWVGTCDGEGAFAIIAVTGKGRRRRLANVVLRTTGEIRDGFYDGDVSDEMVAQMLKAVEEETDARHVKVPLAQAADLVTTALNQATASGARIPADARMAVQAITSVLPVRPPPVPAAAQVDVEWLETYLADPAFESWFFDEGDLGGLEPPKSGKLTKGWHAKATARLEPIAQDRVVGMARHLAWWCQASGDLVGAAQFAACAQETARDFRGSALVRRMLESTLLAMEESAEGDLHAGPPIGRDEGLRRQLKARYFADLGKPTGRDLARLDYTEVAYAALREAYTEFPSESRPPDEVLLDAAAALGPALVTMVSEDEFVSVNLQPLFDASPGLTAEQRQVVMSLPFQLALSFAEDVCAQCPVRCLDRPNGAFAKAFDDARHPAHAVLPPAVEL